jgi:hypothetical protein
VIVNKSRAGNATVSNAFPTDLVAPSASAGDAPQHHERHASTIDALIPGTAEDRHGHGQGLDLTTSLLLDGSPIDAARWTIVDSTTITLDMPQASSLGAHDIGATDGALTDNFSVTIVAPATPSSSSAPATRSTWSTATTACR